MVNTELGLRLEDKSHVDPAAGHLVYSCLRSENELLSSVQRGVYHSAGDVGVASPQIISLPDPESMSFRVSEDVDTWHSTKPLPCQAECREPVPSQHYVSHASPLRYTLPILSRKEMKAQALWNG